MNTFTNYEIMEMVLFVIVLLTSVVFGFFHITRLSRRSLLIIISLVVVEVAFATLLWKEAASIVTVCIMLSVGLVWSELKVLNRKYFHLRFSGRIRKKHFKIIGIALIVILAGFRQDLLVMYSGQIIAIVMLMWIINYMKKKIMPARRRP